MARLSLREAFQRSRSRAKSLNHDWDVADAMAAVEEADAEAGDVEARVAALATGSALRRASLRSIGLLSKLTGLRRKDAKVVSQVIDILDVPEAGESLPPQPTSPRKQVRDRGHPEGVYPPTDHNDEGR